VVVEISLSLLFLHDDNRTVSKKSDYLEHQYIVTRFLDNATVISVFRIW
jgi:hypothetical protein